MDDIESDRLLPIDRLENNDAAASAHAPGARHRRRILILMFKALVILVIRLWIASLLVCVLYLMARRIPGVGQIRMANGQVISDDASINIIPDSNASKVFANAVPALFGSLLESQKTGMLIHLTGIDSCSRFSYDFPPVDGQIKQRYQSLQKEKTSYLKSIRFFSPSMDAEKKIDALENDETMPWFALVPRGGCPFDKKVFHAQAAGFSAVIIYNNDTSYGGSSDHPVRMSSHSLGPFVHAISMFLTGQEAQQLIKYIQWWPAIVTLEPYDWMFNGRAVRLLVMDMLFLLFSATLCGSACMAICFVFTILRNYFVYNEFLVMETIEEGSQLILLPPAPKPPRLPRLKKVDFPIKVLTDEDFQCPEGESIHWIERHGFAHDSCAICIEEFVAGNHVRLLPCKHVFHDTCVDPWLLRHNRLCPICKQDVVQESQTEPEPSNMQRLGRFIGLIDDE